ncbi:MAG: hypothetical protein AB8G99_19895 [Planctomycetaceae bacterium]
MWFKELVGFEEENADQVRQNIQIDGNQMKSLVTGRIMRHGRLETPSLAELRDRVSGIQPKGSISVEELVGDTRQIHLDGENASAFMHVASQFNLLEMPSSQVTPDDGIDDYEHDLTQGPACAIACGAGTLFRNYFAEVNGGLGQTAERQIDCLSDLGTELGNRDNQMWEMRNGYCFATENGLRELADILSNSTRHEQAKELLRIGVQTDTEVTLQNARHVVTQAYCSAVPVAYSSHSAELWKPFARFVLEASYEATILAAILNADRTGQNKAFLTLIGGGVFGNPQEWIIDALRQALDKYRGYGLEVMIVSYRQSSPDVRSLVDAFTD